MCVNSHIREAWENAIYSCNGKKMHIYGLKVFSGFTVENIMFSIKDLFGYVLKIHFGR